MHTGKTDETFGFGLEAEFGLYDLNRKRALWYEDMSFDFLQRQFAHIDISDFSSLDGLGLEPLESTPSPFIVEGYHLPDQDFAAVDCLPKGVEIRTPVADTIEECLNSFELLYGRLQRQLKKEGIAAYTLSHHPWVTSFQGPQNKRRHDYWQWAMQVMTTYGPDFNISLPASLNRNLDVNDLEAKVNYYAPAMVALSVGSPFVNGELWEHRGEVGLSYRTFKRSLFAPAIEIHPDEKGRLEFKSFDMSWHVGDLEGYFLLALTLMLDQQLIGRAADSMRVYDLGDVARRGLNAELVDHRLEELFSHAYKILPAWGFSIKPLKRLEQRWQLRLTPAHELIHRYRQEQSLSSVLEFLTNMNFDRCSGNYLSLGSPDAAISVAAN